MFGDYVLNFFICVRNKKQEGINFNFVLNFDELNLYFVSIFKI